MKKNICKNKIMSRLSKSKQIFHKNMLSDIDDEDEDLSAYINTITASKVRSLINSKVDVNSRNEFMETPLMLSNNIDVLKLLIKSKANINSQDKYGFTALMLAVNQFDIHKIELLIESKADTNIKNKYGKNVLDIVNEASAENVSEEAIKKNKDIYETYYIQD